MFFGFGLNPDKSITFALPIPEQLSFQGNIENPDILCHIKLTTDVVDSDGKIIASEQSAFFSGNPITTFSFTDKIKDTEVSGFVVTPKIKCDTPDTRDLFDFGQVPVTIKSNDAIVKVFSKAKDGKHLTETFNKKFTYNSVELKDNKEQSLGSVKISSSDILKAMETGKYDSYQHIVVESDFDIFWSGYPSVIYRLTSTTEKTHNSQQEIVEVKSDLITYREIKIDKEIGSEVTDPKECGTNQFLKSGVCVTLTGNGVTNPTEITNTSVNGISEFTTCAFSNPDKSCLMSATFAPFYLIGVGLIGVGLASRPKPRQIVYGVPQ